MTQLARFNADGLLAFREVLGDVANGQKVTAPLEIIADSLLTEAVGGVGDIELATFSTRMDLAAHLNTVLNRARSSDLMRDTGLWAWLSAAFFDTVCPPDDHGHRNPLAEYRHIPSNDWRHFYRHLIRGAVRIYRLFEADPPKATIVLCQHPSKPGDFVEQLCSRQERITNPAIIEAANRLYLDPRTLKPKRGSSPNSPKPGTLRRYSNALDQLDLTFDLYSMSAEDLLTILPKEFSKYRA